MKCIHCSSEILEGASFCIQCGRPTEAADPQQPASVQPGKKPSGRVWIWLIIGISIGVVIGAGALLLMRALELLPSAGLSDQPQASPTTDGQTSWPRIASEPLPVPEEVWLTLSGVEVQHQEQPLQFDPGVMNGGVQDDDYTTFLGTGNWDDSWIGIPGFSEGEALMVRFRFGEGAHFDMGFRTGESDSTDAFQFGFTADSSVQLVQQGENLPRRDFYGNLSLEPDTWYCALLGLGPQGDIFIILWDEVYNRMALIVYENGADWPGVDWTFHFGVFVGWVDISRADTYSINGIRVRPSEADWSGTWSMAGIGGYTQGHEIRQSNGRITAIANLEGDDVRVFDGTALNWIDEAGEQIDIVRGAFLVYPSDAMPGSTPGYFPIAWRLSTDGQRISGSGHGGVTMHCLKREETADYPSTCYWYYYDRLACVEANEEDFEACGYYGEMMEAGMRD